MWAKVIAVVVFAVALCAVADPNAGSQSICDRYSALLRVSNTILLQTVVNGTVAAIVVPSAPTKKYFDGTKPPGSTNFLANQVALSALTKSLVNFFWGPLGCTDKPVRNYTGGSMAAVHGAMGINDLEFDFFENALLGVLTKAGVTRPDVKSVKTVLESTRRAIVTTQSKKSICDKYSKALGVPNKALLTTLVNAIVGKLVAPSSIVLKYFDGTKPAGSTNFTDPRNAASLAALVKSLSAFFWVPLGCSDQPPLVYQGGAMGPVHKAMGINGLEFDFFVTAAGKALTDAGVTSDDLKVIAGVLNSLKGQIVNGQ
jgi:phage tail tube protein FII